MKFVNCLLYAKVHRLKFGFHQVYFNPIALRKAKIAYSFGLSECKRVKKPKRKKIKFETVFLNLIETMLWCNIIYRIRPIYRTVCLVFSKLQEKSDMKNRSKKRTPGTKK